MASKGPRHRLFPARRIGQVDSSDRANPGFFFKKNFEL
jgi:hypothetical protein